MAPAAVRLRALRNHLAPTPLHDSPAAATAAAAAVAITDVTTRDVRFALPAGDGTDSVHSLGGRIYYGYGVTVLHTDDPDGLSGDGLGFTLGAGTDMVCAAIGHLAKPLVGREVEELMASFGETWHALAEHPALRWLGPHNGVLHLALASIANACFDLWAKTRGVPLWELLLSLEDEQVVDLLDLSYCEDVLTRAEALELLAVARPGREQRAAALRASGGIPGYDTSAGWMDCTDDEITERSRTAVAKGFKAVKLKVVRSPSPLFALPSRWELLARAKRRLAQGGLAEGSETNDLRRLELVHDAVGDEISIAFDANQRQCCNPAAPSVLASSDPCLRCLILVQSGRLSKPSRSSACSRMS